MTEKTATEASNDFWLAFKAEKTGIEDLLEKASSKPKVELPTYFNTIVQLINDLEKKLTKATEFIPSYDERQYSLQLKELTSTLESKRTELTPKPKFSFKSRNNNNNKKKATATVIPSQVTETNKEEEYIGGATIVFKDRQNQVLKLSDYKREESNKSVDVLLSNLSHCVVLLEEKEVQVSALHIKNVDHCVILGGHIQGSVLMYGLGSSIMAIGCHQLRMHDAHHVDILLHVTSKPIIEDSNHVCFGSYSISEEVDAVNYYDQVEDFNWLKKQASPNWSLMVKTRQDMLCTQLEGKELLTIDGASKLLSTLQ
ncbi:TBCC-domain-containing protein [Backusella circina FSU 941]|nr:TBCC-domain-containing protein [Backusella circina FSU 941]